MKPLIEYGESPCWCGSDACIGQKHLLAGFHCARRRHDEEVIAALLAALKALLEDPSYQVMIGGNPHAVAAMLARAHAAIAKAEGRS